MNHFILDAAERVRAASQDEKRYVWSAWVEVAQKHMREERVGLQLRQRVPLAPTYGVGWPD